MHSKDHNYCDRILGHARTAARRTAILGPDHSLTFADHAWSFGGVAHGLDQSDVPPGAVVGILTDGQAPALRAWLGVILGGRVALLLDTGSADAEMARLLAATGAQALLVDRSVPAARATAIAGHLQTIAIETLPESADPFARRRDGGDRLAQIIVSSGTTGPSKAAPCSHHQLAGRMDAQAWHLDLGPADRHRPIISMNFIMGRYPVLRTLDAGGTAIFRPLPRTMPDLAASLNADGVTYLSLTPSHVTAMLNGLPERPQPALPAVRVLLVSSAMMSLAARQAVMTRLTPNLQIGYGSNEAGSITHATPGELALKPGTVGRAVRSVTLEVVDDQGTPLPPGALGEIRVRSPLATQHYIGDPEATGRTNRDGWFHMGDTGHLDVDGYLFIAGRVDDRINFAGRKLYPVEIEEVLLAHPAVAEAAALALPSAHNQEVPVAAVVLRQPVPEQVLLDHCRAMLVGWKVPRRIFVFPSLPRTSMRKIMTPELRQLILDQMRTTSGLERD
ncbi:long-chain acyl-CoA synthetase [Stella humosa]|uniref:Long-chain acyl-CoA synthetase n=1 Tax=Stella humosa TaxID=94 RepID=A0A3N1M9B1_9PROT|nr:class I adenylate-forming enzyme family protein [Stella humosa]ROP99624.1 long-chain acyl-CoA synthetase [Stella humosa]BBK31151.1 acyl-CoA synthetase [Stella humosa]